MQIFLHGIEPQMVLTIKVLSNTHTLWIRKKKEKEKKKRPTLEWTQGQNILEKLTCLNLDGAVLEFVIAKNTRHPSIKIVHSSTDIFYRESAIRISLSPELVALFFHTSQSKIVNSNHFPSSKKQFHILTICKSTTLHIIHVDLNTKIRWMDLERSLV